MKTLASKSAMKRIKELRSKGKIKPLGKLKKATDFFLSSSPYDVLDSSKTQELILPSDFPTVYSYRVSTNWRILFSIKNIEGEETLFIHDIIDMREL